MKKIPTIRAFTLIESLVAVAIIGLAVGGPLYAANRSFMAAQNSRNQLTASLLAQEGIEYVRKLRDNDYISSRADTEAAWTNFVDRVDPLCRDNFCTFDVFAKPLTACSGTCPASELYLNSLNQYVQDPTAPNKKTIFTRVIQAIDPPGSSKAVKIVSMVRWDFHGTTYNVKVIDTLMSWQPEL